MAPQLAAVMRAQRDRLIDAWAGTLRKRHQDAHLSRHALVDAMPHLLDELAERIETAAGASEEPEAARWHFEDRLAQGFDLAHVTTELGVLRDVLLAALPDEGDTVALQRRRLNHLLDEAVRAAVARYLAGNEQRMVALDRLSQDALARVDLRRFLSELAAHLTGSSRSLSQAAIAVEEDGAQVVRAVSGTARAVLPGDPAERLGQWAVDARRSGETRGSGSECAVPLIAQGRIIGLVHVVASEGTAYSAEDHRHTLRVAERAAMAIQVDAWRRTTEQRAQELARREEQWSLLLEALPEGVVGLDHQGRCTFANPAALRLLERGAASEVMGHSVHALVHARSGEGGHHVGDCPLLRALRSGTPLHGSDEFCRRESGLLAVECRLRPLRVGDQADGGVLTFHDVTARRRAAEAETLLAEVTATLTESLETEATIRRLLELLTRSLADWATVDTLDGEGRPQIRALVHRNPARQQDAELAMGVYVPEGPRWKVLHGGGPQLLTTMWEGLERALREEPRRGQAYQALAPRTALAVPLTARGRLVGCLTLISCSVQRPYDEEDLRLAMEIARRAALAIDNADLYEQTRAAVRTRETVLAVVSHDLKNPLATVKFAVDLLGRRLGPQPPQNNEYLELMNQATQRMERLISDLLDVGNMQAGRFSVVPAACATGQLVKDAVQAVQAAASARRVTLAEDLSQPLPTVMVDRDRMVQVLVNLLDNAIKFSTEGGSVTVRARALDRVVEVSVADAGPGISAEDQRRIFEPFWSAATRPARQSSGLGLFIARGIVEAHRGELRVESQRGRGTVFTVSLPVADQGLTSGASASGTRI